jgi:phospholipase/carboxylesterase
MTSNDAKTMIPEVFQYVRYDAPAGHCPLTWLLLHGTGGSEEDLIPLAREVFPDAARLSPRGQVMEGGARRFFRRFAEGVLDIDDWRRRSGELAAFVRAQGKERQRDATGLLALGYSNGANIAQGLLLLAPDTLSGAILLRPMFVNEPDPPEVLAGKRVLLLCGRHDPLAKPDDPERLAAQYRRRGADVQLEIVEAGHNLVQEDLEIMRGWVGRYVAWCPNTSPNSPQSNH